MRVTPYSFGVKVNGDLMKAPMCAKSDDMLYYRFTPSGEYDGQILKSLVDEIKFIGDFDDITGPIFGVMIDELQLRQPGIKTIGFWIDLTLADKYRDPTVVPKEGHELRFSMAPSKRQDMLSVWCILHLHGKNSEIALVREYVARLLYVARLQNDLAVINCECSARSKVGKQMEWPHDTWCPAKGEE